MDISSYIAKAVNKIQPDLNFDFAKWDSIKQYHATDCLVINMQELLDCVMAASENDYLLRQWNRYLAKAPDLEDFYREKYHIKRKGKTLCSFQKDTVFLAYFLRFAYVSGIYQEPIFSMAKGKLEDYHYYLNEKNDIIIRHGIPKALQNSKTAEIRKPEEIKKLEELIKSEEAGKAVKKTTASSDGQETQFEKNSKKPVQTTGSTQLEEEGLLKIPTYQEVLQRSRSYNKPYQELHIITGKKRYLNELECFILQLMYQINVVFEEDIRVLINAVNTEEEHYSLITIIRKLVKHDYIIVHMDDTYGKYYSYTAGAERLLNPMVKSPKDFQVTPYIERYRLISSFSCIQLTKDLKPPFFASLKHRFSQLSFANNGIRSEIEKSKRFFKVIVWNEMETVSVLDIELHYSHLIKIKTILCSKRKALQTSLKQLLTKGARPKESEEVMKQLKQYEGQIAYIDSKMKEIRVYLGDNYVGMKKETVPTLYYFLKSGIIWSITTDGCSYQCNVIFLDFSLYGNQDNLFQKVCALSSYFQSRLNTSNFHIRLSLFRVDDERKKEYKQNVKKALEKVAVARASGNRFSGIDRNTFIAYRNGKEYYRIYNLLTYYQPYKDVIPLRFAERDYKREYYQRKKNQN